MQRWLRGLKTLKLFRTFKSFEFSHNTQSWQRFHFCTTSNANKLVIFASQLNFDANLHLICYFESKYMWLTTVCTLIVKFKQYRNANVANFVYYGKTLFCMDKECQICKIVRSINNKVPYSFLGPANKPTLHHHRTALMKMQFNEITLVKNYG